MPTRTQTIEMTGDAQAVERALDDIRLKVVCENGTAMTTSVVDSEGRQLDHVQRVEWTVDSDSMIARATIHLMPVAADITLDEARFVATGAGPAVPLPSDITARQAQAITDAVVPTLRAYEAELRELRRELREAKAA